MALVTKMSDIEREAINKIGKQQINHFSHRHPLEAAEVHGDDDKLGACAGCEHDIVGPAYVCTKATCNFVLHDLCSDLPRRHRHRCHPGHPLALLPSPPYSDGEFTCDACGESGHGFTYHCAACKFDLHVECAALPEAVKRSDHQHDFVLTMCGENLDGGDLVCCGCDDDRVAKGGWMYCCLDCKLGLHLACAETC
ncbi:uncharacterized protein LOC125201748 [Salvia hispanica]|uniref:uncharacterized protein LOC125201748 n=1 Tax=Salvia hispanica TaxID=49212 RepID=UPI002009D684|nr:uncharacterized protein LOC125201748 [Salvia hispanica]